MEASNAYKEFKGPMVEKVKDEAHQIESQFKDQFKKVKASATGAYDNTVEYIEKHPVPAVLIAAGVGVVLAALLRRS